MAHRAEPGMVASIVNMAKDPGMKKLRKKTREMRNAATRGSPPFNDSEIEKGFRCIK